jgi:uncharacterized membrane-anchored protein YjiN (DUF445 family)
MVFTLNDANKLRNYYLAVENETIQRRVDELCKKALPIEEVEQQFRSMIQQYPKNRRLAICVLDVVVNDYGEPTARQLREQIAQAIQRMYKEHFPDAKVSDAPHIDNQGIQMWLFMDLC